MSREVDKTAYEAWHNQRKWVVWVVACCFSHMQGRSLRDYCTLTMVAVALCASGLLRLKQPGSRLLAARMMPDG
jgi:hypothetical protein